MRGSLILRAALLATTRPGACAFVELPDAGAQRLDLLLLPEHDVTEFRVGALQERQLEVNLFEGNLTAGFNCLALSVAGLDRPIPLPG